MSKIKVGDRVRCYDKTIFKEYYRGAGTVIGVIGKHYYVNLDNSGCSPAEGALMWRDELRKLRKKTPKPFAVGDRISVPTAEYPGSLKASETPRRKGTIREIYSHGVIAVEVDGGLGNWCFKPTNDLRRLTKNMKGCPK